MQKLLMGEAQCRTVQARYYLLEEALGEEAPSYGVEIELGDESAAVTNLSPSRQRVEDLVGALVRGGVTPVALRDVVDDWLLK